MSNCDECNGTGTIDLSIGPERIVECEVCGGSGEVEGDSPTQRIPLFAGALDSRTLDQVTMRLGDEWLDVDIRDEGDGWYTVKMPDGATDEEIERFREEWDRVTSPQPVSISFPRMNRCVACAGGVCDKHGTDQ